MGNGQNENRTTEHEDHIMGMQAEPNTKDLAKNLIDSVGPQRGRHVARQFGWYGVVAEIDRMRAKEKAAAQTAQTQAG